MPGGWRRFSCAALALASFAATPAVRAEMRYSLIDRSTVRVFSIRTVTTTDVTTKSDHSYRLAVPEVGHGSGIRVARDGLVLTAYHVVAKARFVAVKGPGDAHARPARVVLADKEHDYAFLAVPGTFEAVTPLPATAPELAVRQTIFAVGYPLDADREHPQSNRGIVAGLLKDGSLQLDVAVNPGNSGGPVVDEHESLLGIVVARGDPKKGIEGIGVAVPLDFVLTGYRTVSQPNGAAERAHALVERSDAGAWAMADLIATMTQHDSVVGIVHEAAAAIRGEDADERPVILPKLTVAVQQTNSRDADVLTLAAAYEWNAAAVARDLQKDEWRARYRRAKALCEQAVALDATLPRRSSFVEMVLGTP